MALHGKYNSGETQINEKGYTLGMFFMWLVRISIAKLLYLPILEKDGCVYQYHTNSTWIVECPDGTILKFKQDKGLYKGFPFIDMDNLSEHILKPSSVAEKLSEVNRRTR